MDLRTVLADGTDGLGNAALARYCRDTFALHLPPESYPGAFRVRAALHFGVQQLATRSRVDRAHERFLQSGCFAEDDHAAALIDAMAHTDVDRRADAGIDDLRSGCYGFVAVFAADPAPFRRLLNPRGQMLVVERDGPAHPARLRLA